MNPNLPTIQELRRLPSPVPTPQALAWGKNGLWISSRDARRLVCVDPQAWTVLEDTPTPGIAWGAVAVGDALYLVNGEGEEDDRYLRRYRPRVGFEEGYRVALPELTGSYLSDDGQHLYVSQWYKHRVLQLDPEGGIVRRIDIGAEICGHVIVGPDLYVLRGTEKDGEDWHVAKLDFRQENPSVEEIARVPFACRSLAFDGAHFWTNHRANHETVSFDLPAS